MACSTSAAEERRACLLGASTQGHICTGSCYAGLPGQQPATEQRRQQHVAAHPVGARNSGISWAVAARCAHEHTSGPKGCREAGQLWQAVPKGLPWLCRGCGEAERQEQGVTACGPRDCGSPGQQGQGLITKGVSQAGGAHGHQGSGAAVEQPQICSSCGS